MSFKSATNLDEESFHLYSTIFNTLEQSPLRVDVYEKILANVDGVVRHVYQSAGYGNGNRATPEREMLITSAVPPVLHPAVGTILRKTMPAIRSEVDRMGLCLYDYSWLGIVEDKQTEVFKRLHEIDILKKISVRADLPERERQPKRRCVRCGEISEDLALPKSFFLLRLMAKAGVLRSCICGGMWAVENLENIKLVSSGTSNG